MNRFLTWLNSRPGEFFLIGFALGAIWTAVVLVYVFGR